MEMKRKAEQKDGGMKKEFVSLCDLRWRNSRFVRLMPFFPPKPVTFFCA